MDRRGEHRKAWREKEKERERSVVVAISFLEENHVLVIYSYLVLQWYSNTWKLAKSHMAQLPSSSQRRISSSPSLGHLS